MINYDKGPEVMNGEMSHEEKVFVSTETQNVLIHLRSINARYLSSNVI